MKNEFGNAKLVKNGLKTIAKIFIFGPETNPPRRAKPKISKSELNIYFTAHDEDKP